jgi:predicted TIM-barrel fold metal-dependent hydrolase
MGTGPFIDAHVHLFPDALFEAIWDWFDTNAWPIARRLKAGAVLDALEAAGAAGAVGLCYAHKPGLAEGLNAFMASLAARHPGLIPIGTVFPGEPDEREVLRRAFAVHRLRGIKIHCHVQPVSPDSETLAATCQAVSDHAGVLVIHAGRAPALPATRAAIAGRCGVERTARMLKRFPSMKTIVPHLGMDEYREYRDLLPQFPNLFLDTAMAIGGYFGGEPAIADLEDISDRVLFGTDFPNLPYPHRKELDALLAAGLSVDVRERILWRNTERLFRPVGIRSGSGG